MISHEQVQLADLGQSAGLVHAMLEWDGVHGQMVHRIAAFADGRGPVNWHHCRWHGMHSHGNFHSLPKINKMAKIKKAFETSIEIFLIYKNRNVVAIRPWRTIKWLN